MSLQVWLPLTKDTRNQGLITLPSPWEAWTRDNNGKLGQYCYSDCAIYHMTDEWLNNEWSLACWVKSSGWSQYNDILLCKNVSESTSSQFYFSIINGATLNLGTNGGSGGVSYSYTFATNTWYHVAATYNGSIACLYINGIQVKSQSYATTKLNNMNNFCVGCRSTNSAGTSGTGNTGVKRLNDVRVYNHCLSPMEVKQISQGLILHYPLNRQGWGQENLVWNSNWNTHSTTPPESWVNWGSPPTREIVTIDGKNWLHVISNTARFQGYSQNWTKRNGMGELTANAKMTISFTAKLAVAASIAPIGIHWCNSSGTIIRQNWTTTALTTDPKRYSFTYTTPADCVAFNIMVGDDTDTAHEVWVTDIKLEFGEIATPWCPNSSDELVTTMGLNSTIEYDCSGYCNNGSKMTDTITYTSDTAKYAVSTHFNGTYDGIIIENLVLKDMINSTITYAFWIKPESESGARSIYFGSYSGISWSIEKTTGNQLRLYWNGSPDETCSGATITDGVWQHICITKNGTNDVKVYINGIQKWTSTATHSNLNFPTTYRIGRDTRSNDGTPYKGLMSDFRIYATALSADDVKSLYQNCATIDPDGTIRGQIRN